MTLAVIPARGGSKRIPRKNIRPFAGKPMIAFAIEAALCAGLFDHVVVSTDDEEIANVARDYGAETPFVRAPELSDDHTPTVPVVADAIERCAALGWPVEAVCCLYPGVPLIDPADIVAAYALLVEAGEGYVFPVTAFPSVIQRALRRTGDGRVAPFDPQYAATRTQDLEPAYYDAGQFYWGTADSWLARQTIHAHGRAIVLPEWRVADIDTLDDWERAERLYMLSRIPAER